MKRFPWKKTIVFVIAFFCLSAAGMVPAPVEGAPYDKVEVFDVAQGKVVSSFANSEEIQKEVKAWLHSITGVSPQTKIDPKHGLILKIPVQPAIRIKNQWIKDDVVEVFLPISPANLQQPVLLLFTGENKPMVFQFHYDLKPFLKKHGIWDLMNKAPAKKPYI